MQNKEIKNKALSYALSVLYKPEKELLDRAIEKLELSSPENVVNILYSIEEFPQEDEELIPMAINSLLIEKLQSSNDLTKPEMDVFLKFLTATSVSSYNTTMANNPDVELEVAEKIIVTLNDMGEIFDSPIIKKKIDYFKEKKEFIEIKPSTHPRKKEPTTMKWVGSNLSKLTRRINEEGLTSKPTSFEKLFKGEVIKWLGDPHTLAYLFYKLYSNVEDGEPKPLIIPSKGKGYLKTASIYISYCDDILQSQQKINLSDLLYKVRNSRRKYTDTKKLVDSILRDLK